MKHFRLTPARVVWMGLLCALFILAPRLVRQSPPRQARVGSLASDSRLLQPNPLAPRPIRDGSVPGESLESAPQAKALDAADDLFDSDSLPRLEIQIPRSGLEILQNYHWQQGNAARTDVPAMVREGDAVYTNVAIHLKGSAGSFQPVHGRPSLTLNFDKFAPGQRFHGLKKIHLNASHQDRSLLAEQISREMFLAAGVPVPRATQARVNLNGRNLGVYGLVEGWNKQFLRRHFKDDSGVLYDGGFLQDIGAPLEVDSGDENTDRADLQMLAEAARRKNASRVESLLDVDRFLSFVAMEALLGHWDGYTMNINNYRIYHDPQTDRLVFMPHGLDQMFGYPRGRFSSGIFLRRDGGPSLPIRGRLARDMLTVDSWHERYVQRVGELYTNVYKTDVILARIDELYARLRPFVAEDGIPSALAHRAAVESLRSRIAEQGRNVAAQLARPPQPVRLTALQFDPSRMARLNGWQPKQSTVAQYGPAPTAAGASLLSISLPGTGSGSWRTQVRLEPGRYRFTGRAKAQDLVLNPGEPKLDAEGRKLLQGVGLRVSGGEQQQRLVSNADWSEVYCDFEIQEAQSVELVCELHAQQGQAFFDTASLKLVRR